MGLIDPAQTTSTNPGVSVIRVLLTRVVLKCVIHMGFSIRAGDLIRASIIGEVNVEQWQKKFCGR